MKTLDEFVVLFAEQFFRTEPATIKADTVFHDLEQWSSLTALSVIAMVDDEFGVTISGNDLHNAVTVEDVYKCIITKL